MSERSALDSALLDCETAVRVEGQVGAAAAGTLRKACQAVVAAGLLSAAAQARLQELEGFQAQLVRTAQT